jgi:hypothetical protein
LPSDVRAEERDLLRLRRRETIVILVGTAIPYATAIVVVIAIASMILPRTARWAVPRCSASSPASLHSVSLMDVVSAP